MNIPSTRGDGDPSGIHPLVSIIIPCYRQAHLLAEAIDSGLAQSYPAVEIIVVNDGSDDDTDEVAAGYGDRIHYVHRLNGGLPAARNTGVAAARGTYLKFLDADDYLHPDQIAWQVEAMEGRTDRVSLTTVRLFQEHDPDQFEDHVPTATALLPDLFRDIPWGGIHGFLFPKALVEAVGGFDESLRFIEDWELLARIGMLGPGLVTEARVGAYYRLRPGSMSTNWWGMAATAARVLIQLHDTLRDGPRPDWFHVDLLGVEQRTYHRLLYHGVRDPALRTALRVRIRELQAIAGPGPLGPRFGRLVDLIGYPAAEWFRCTWGKTKARIS